MIRTIFKKKNHLIVVIAALATLYSPLHAMEASSSDDEGNLTLTQDHQPERPGVLRRCWNSMFCRNARGAAEVLYDQAKDNPATVVIGTLGAGAVLTGVAPVAGLAAVSGLALAKNKDSITSGTGAAYDRAEQSIHMVNEELRKTISDGATDIREATVEITQELGKSTRLLVEAVGDAVTQASGTALFEIRAAGTNLIAEANATLQGNIQAASNTLEANMGEMKDFIRTNIAEVTNLPGRLTQTFGEEARRAIHLIAGSTFKFFAFGTVAVVGAAICYKNLTQNSNKKSSALAAAGAGTAIVSTLIGSYLFKKDLQAEQEYAQEQQRQRATQERLQQENMRNHREQMTTRQRELLQSLERQQLRNDTMQRIVPDKEVSQICDRAKRCYEAAYDRAKNLERALLALSQAEGSKSRNRSPNQAREMRAVHGLLAEAEEILTLARKHYDARHALITQHLQQRYARAQAQVREQHGHIQPEQAPVPSNQPEAQTGEQHGHIQPEPAPEPNNQRNIVSEKLREIRAMFEQEAAIHEETHALTELKINQMIENYNRVKRLIESMQQDLQTTPQHTAIVFEQSGPASSSSPSRPTSSSGPAVRIPSRASMQSSAASGQPLAASSSDASAAPSAAPSVL